MPTSGFHVPYYFSLSFRIRIQVYAENANNMAYVRVKIQRVSAVGVSWQKKVQIRMIFHYYETE